MQSHANDVTINEIPKFIASDLTNETHSIIVLDPDEPVQRVIFPLAVRRVTTYFPPWHITRVEWESGSNPSLEMTNEFLE